jgi:GNAT superfamily N-acetyltransferase
VNVNVKVTAQTDDAARDMIIDGLGRFNVEMAGIDDDRTLDVLALNADTGEVLGGLVGRTSLGVLFVNYLFLPASLRRGGVGRRIMLAAEEEAVHRGCLRAILFTISFQAPEFYEGLGYKLFGTVKCNPPEISRIFMSKELANRIQLQTEAPG